MKWTTLPEKPAAWGPELWAFELAKIEALRAIAEELENLPLTLAEAMLASAGPDPHRAGMEAARRELLNVMNILEVELGAHAPAQTREQLLELLKRARTLCGADLP